MEYCKLVAIAIEHYSENPVAPLKLPSIEPSFLEKAFDTKKMGSGYSQIVSQIGIGNDI